MWAYFHSYARSSPGLFLSVNLCPQFWAKWRVSPSLKGGLPFSLSLLLPHGSVGTGLPAALIFLREAGNLEVYVEPTCF